MTLIQPGVALPMRKVVHVDRTLIVYNSVIAGLDPAISFQ